MKLQYARLLTLLGLSGLSMAKSVCKRISDGEAVEDASIPDINECYACNGWYKVEEGNAYSVSSWLPETEVVYRQEYEWCGESADDKFEVIYRRPIKFAGFSVSSSEPDTWVKELEVWYGDDSSGLSRAKNSNFGELFPGNAYDQLTKQNKFGLPFTATFIRVVPKSYQSKPCLRINFYSCKKRDNSAPEPPMSMDMDSDTDFDEEDIESDEMNEDDGCPPFECNITCLIFVKDDYGCSTCACDETNPGMLEADIRIDSSSRRAAEIAYGIREEPNGVMRGGMTDASRRWVDNKSGDNYIISYVLDNSLENDAKQAIPLALQEIESATCLRFQLRTDDQYYMKFFEGSGCWSYVGNAKFSSGGQQISIGRGCQYKGIIQHEVLHALGFWHEQSRVDRDDYVKILWQNIQEGRENNFNKQNTRSFSSPYDFKSIMHYGNKAFSDNNKDTIQAISDPSMKLGQRDGLTEEDIKQVRSMYECSGTGVTTTTTPTTTTTMGPCNNESPDRHCTYWEKRGYCLHTYVAFMKKNCAMTCRTCPTTCANKRPDYHCTYWQGMGYCTQKYVLFMKTYCAKACGVCG